MFAQHPALVSRATKPRERNRYLMLTSKGAAWTPDPAMATAFASMREAMRAAVHLPAATRAYGLPLESELSLYRAH